MPGVTDIFIESRRALLDAVDALAEQRHAVVLVGAQAIYLYTGHADVPIATTTRDSDLVLDPQLVAEEPLLEDAMKAAGFDSNVGRGGPGSWMGPNNTPVDLLVPATLVPAVGSRGARIPPHDKHAARKVLGLEAAIVDYREMEVSALEGGDERRTSIKVAGPAALVVAKMHKLAERQESPGRLLDKDAHDVYRLLAAVDTKTVADGFEHLLSDARSKAVAERALSYLREIFGSETALGPVMAGRTEEGVGDPALVAASVVALVEDLLQEVDRRRDVVRLAGSAVSS